LQWVPPIYSGSPCFAGSWPPACSPWPRAQNQRRPAPKENHATAISFLANLSSSVDDSPTIEEAAALYLDPRHRFLSSGPESLTETEAISIILGERDYHLATRLLVSFGSLTALSRTSLSQLSPLLGKARAMRLIAAFRLGPLSSLGQCKEAIDKPELVYNLFAQELRLAAREILAVALLDTRFRLIKKEQISVGILNEALAHPREILKPAIVHSAYAFALVHNLWAAPHRLCTSTKAKAEW
jgi:DNA repair protein RadC